MKIKLQFITRCEEDDFLLLPCPAVSYVKHKNNYAFAIGIKLGFWAIALCFYRIVKNGQ